MFGFVVIEEIFCAQSIYSEVTVNTYGNKPSSEDISSQLSLLGEAMGELPN